MGKRILRKAMENKIAEILDKYDQVLEAIVADLTEAGFNSACHFISPRNPAIRVGFVHEGSEVDGLKSDEREALVDEMIEKLTGELDRIDRELKIYKHAFLKDQMIEDGEL